MGSANFQGLEGTGMRKVLCLLEPLRHSPTGAVIYRQVERMLGELVDDQQSVERAYLVLINQLLEAYVGHLRAGSPLQFQVRLLQAHLQPPLTTVDMATLRDYVELYAGQIESLGQVDSELFKHAVEPLLAAFGIAENAIDDKQLEHALAQAQLLDFARTLPQGLNTTMGEHGQRLSGGQRQRIGIARALYHRPDLLVLDEATAALDLQTEQDINAALQALRGQLTLIVIAHRLSTVKICDRLIYLDQGRLVDQGSFTELHARNGSFRALVKLGRLDGWEA